MDTATEAVGSAIAIHWQIAAKLNFACHQSSFPVLRDLRIENLDEEERLDDLLVTISADPAFLKPRTWPIDRIAPGGVVPVRQRDLQLDGGFLVGLDEAMRGTVTLRVERDGAVLAEEKQTVELLARNEWGGAGYMPELLAAFSMPNDPAVDRVLHDASLALRKAGKPDGLDGYQSGKRQRVWEVVSAIYTAVSNLGITYALPSPSFERDGQKIRLPSQIMEGRVATCLDATMLFASALEKVGLNPIVALPHGHAVVGAWLQPEELTSIVIDDAETLRKRHQLKELVLFETTYVTSHPAPPFSKAVAAAMETLVPEKDETFGAAVDIKRARAHRILPLGLKESGAGPVEDGHEESGVEVTLEEAPPLPDFDQEVEEETPQTPKGRIERWQRKLLDLSARNPLLAHRASRACLTIICPNPGLLEDKLADGARISIDPVPQPSAQAQDGEIHRQRTGEVISEEYARDALQRGQVLVDLPKDELGKRAVEIYRKAQTALQEGGSNTLYLALGFLLWKRDEKDDRRFRAPLILLPVTLQRQSVRSGIKMTAHDDEPRFNTTLLEMLRRNFKIDIKGLEQDLPKDESGIDVQGIWNIVRKAVKDAPGFEVVEDVVLGHFSFAKYLMWKDLVDRTDALRRNKVVQHLIDTPRDPFKTEIEFVAAERLDRDYKPSDLLTPLPADASQMSAIATADRGKDFIVIGPPGTGKSQTISNLIAHLLGTGKTVLFVSEKTAALNVVHRRLEHEGLGQFCLQLHSSKARKADVLDQLDRAWSSGRRLSAEEWQREADRLAELRDRLNRVVDHLHRRHLNGLTAHYAIGVKVRDEDRASRVALSWPRSEQHSGADLDRMREAAENLRIQASAVGDIRRSPLSMVATGDWSPQWESELVERAGLLSSAADAADSACSTLCEAIGIELPDRTLERLEALGRLAQVLSESYRKQTAYALEHDGADVIEALEQAVQHLKDYAAAQSRLSCRYEPMAWRKLDGDDVERKWQEACAAWWPKSFFARRAVMKELRLGGAVGKPDPASDAPVLRRLRTEGEAIDRLDAQLSSLKAWSAHDTDPDAADALRDLGARAREAAGHLADDAQSLAEARGKVRTLLQDGNDLLAPEASVGRAIHGYLKAFEALGRACGAFEERAGQEARNLFSAERRALEALREAADAIVERKRELNGWCAWRKRRNAAIDLDLKALVDGIEDGRVPVDEIPETFEAAYCAWWSGMIIGEDEVLRTFSTPEHEEAIGKFRRLDEEFRKTTAAYVAAKLSGSLPRQDDVQRSSQWGVLRHEIQKRKRHKPVRQLMQEAPEAVTALAPCLMMSPLSVAQYLPADQALFDVVIFDEASQITVWDAVGAIARGNQVIVAGDPRQMPPTNFFNRSEDDQDGDVDGEGDLESILDELRSSSVPECTLNLHYRSRRESLIAFSNNRYYEDRLVTFPAPVHPDLGVRLLRPSGHYSRGKARTNEGEARAIVAEVVRRLTAEDPEVRDRSIGVVTFNSEQQSLIEDLIDEARRSRPEIEWAFAEDAQEPVFVKNLETVQGDERDVILFSVTYGPDQFGHVTVNFGPLNKSGGERRLNVAMTRARSEMIVFSTLRPDQIDLSRTSARAVTDLKHFLEYAEHGPKALGASVHGSLGDFDSPFETAVARALRDRGWTVHSQIGVSAYRIDIGIVHPDAAGAYLAGVECDGAMYHGAAYARERDKIRQQVLEGLGWSLFRVWSTDWWINKAHALDNLDRQLREHLEADRERRSAAEEACSLDSAAGSGVAASRRLVAPHILGEPDDQAEEPVKESEDSPLAATRIAPEPGRDASLACDVRLGKSPDEAPSESSGDAFSGRPYRKASFDSGRLLAAPEQFYDESYNPRLEAMIDHVIDVEGPIHEDVLVRRIARHHGFQRAGSQIRDRVLKLAKNRHERTHETCGRFFWRKGTANGQTVPARYAGRDNELRKVEYICTEELQAIDRHLRLGGDVVELARAIGVARLRHSARARLEEALALDR